MAADIRHAAGVDIDREALVDEWMNGVGEGVPGYVTPKVAVGAVVGNDDGEILLVQRADSGIWLYPTGWADVGYSASEVAVKEVRRGDRASTARWCACWRCSTGLRLGFTRVPLYSLVFHCRAVGGELKAHPLECADVGWFAERRAARARSPATSCGASSPSPRSGASEPTSFFDGPATPPWRG